MKYLFTVVLLAVSILNVSAMAHDHTHIGRNADGISGTADDHTLWIFATPAQPQWDTIEMLPTGDTIGGKQVYKAELDCWMSAHPTSGLYQLGGSDINQQPDWQIALERVSFSSTDFWMESEATGLEVLTADGQQLDLGYLWMPDNYNETGTLGAWGFHVHTEFCLLADGAGETAIASFKAVDLRTTGFLASDVYTMTFQTMPEPTTLGLLGIGLFSVIRRRK
jgi:hypothetical protein